MMRLRKFAFGVVLLAVVLFMPFVLSFTDSNFAYRSGGFASQAYLGGQNINLYGEQGQEVCSSGKDFVVQIAPLGCTPSVVRSDLLEEQNVAVFCPLIATQINPLIEVDRIDSVSFSGRNYSDQVSGIGFHPTRAALGFRSSSAIGHPIGNDIGYVVVVLKKEPKEADMPEFVKGTLVANIRYKLSDIGVGSATYYVPEMDNAEWGDNFNKYGFWNGKGYIRAEGIGENSATISVYSGGGETDKIRTFTLNKGGSSSEIYVPGFFCQAGAVLRLEGLVNPETRVRLSVSGDVSEFKQGEKFLENKCQVKKLSANGLVQSVIISCQGDNEVSNFELVKSPSVRIKVGDEFKDVGFGERVFDTNMGGAYLAGVKYKKDSGIQEDLEVLIFDSPSTLEKLPISEENKAAAKMVEYGKKIELFDDKIEVTLDGFSAGSNGDFSEFDSNTEFQQYFSGAMGDYDDILGNFGGEKISLSDSVENTYGYQALVDSISLAFETGQKEEAIELCDKFKELYPGESVKECGNKESFSNMGVSGYGVNVNGRFKEISFIEIINPTYNEYGVSLNVGGKPVDLSKSEKQSIGAGEYVQLVSLTDTSADLKIGIKLAKDGKFEEKAVRLNVDEFQNFGSNYSFGINEINLEKVAKIALTPNIKVDGTSTNFSFQIGIEKRAIQLSPEKTETRINKLNETIEKWTELSENLATVVKGLKGACLATGAVLTVKNLFTGMGGTAIARKDVNLYWKGECKDKEYQGETYNSVDDCFLKNSDAIQAAVSARAAIIKQQNNKGINDDNRDARYAEIVRRLNGRKFTPDGGGTNLTVGEDVDISKLSEAGDGGYLMNDREMRNLEMEASILEKNPNEVIAQNNFNRYMGEFYNANKLDSAARSVADTYSIDPKFVSVSAQGVKEEIQTDEYLSSPFSE